MDYRPALRARSGVGEYVHQLAHALTRDHPEDMLTLFTSSWKDRPSVSLPAASVSDHRIPVRVLNLVWHNLEWPPVEWLTRQRCDVAFSPHPLLLPVREAAQVVMVHDLDFLTHPERTQREIRRDYPRLAASHTRRARRVVVPSRYTAGEVTRHFDVPPDRIAVCPPGLPEWQGATPGFDRNGYVLFMGTLEPRKNISGLLAAYRRLLTSGADLPKLVIAGKVGEEASGWLNMMAQPPFAGRVEHIGYVADEDRQRVYAGAHVLVLPSFEEGFGMQVLEAMSLGLPVIVSERGALPELVGDAGLLVDPTDEASIADALARVLGDDQLAATLASRGKARASSFSWRRSASAVHEAFQEAVNAPSSP